MGLTYSRGECVWEDSLYRTFIGFDENDKLIVTEPMTKSNAEKLGIRDGVSFQNGNTLMISDNGEVVIHYSDYNTGTAQRTAIGQKADGTIIMLVTDGRTAASLGATKNEVIDIMVQYGAVTAGMLDGGSSSLMYYENYYEKYNVDESTLDEYQKKGLVNTYKAFTTPRRLPTFICVAKEGK
jgi:exopolysaccharide biosynthesis protein